MKQKKLKIVKSICLCSILIVLFSQSSLALHSNNTNLYETLDISEEHTPFMQITSTLERWDWRDVDGTDWTTPIRDQIQDKCGSCWAFGTLGSLEATYKIWINEPDRDVDLSEQYILSCSSGSCNGWYLTRTLSWIKQNGIIPEECMPYEADDTIPCESKCEDWREDLFGITDFTKVQRGNITAIKDALINYGPLPATMEVYGDFYPEWNGDVYIQNSDEYVFGHVITIVGYDDTWGNEEQGYWICKNSWGPNWGEDGWFRIAYGECKIENSVYYLDGPNYPPSKPLKPEGTNSGEPGEIYSFSTIGNDPNGDELYYLFDWGDQTDSDWLGPYPQNEQVLANHSWDEKGSYAVKVKTRDSLGPTINQYGLESDWSDPLEVSMPKQKSSHNTLCNAFFERLWSNYPIFGLLFDSIDYY